VFTQREISADIAFLTGADGVLRDAPGSVLQATPFTAAPGTYGLEWHIMANGSCSVTSPPELLDGSLTYVLLGTTP